MLNHDCSRVEITEKFLNQQLNNIHDTILNKVFGNEYTNAKTLLKSISSLDSYNYELKVRIIDQSYDRYGTHTSLSMFNIIPEESLILSQFTDDIIITHSSNIPLRNVQFRSSVNTQRSQRKTLINSVSSRSDVSIPLNIQLSKEYVVPSVISLPVQSFQRRLRGKYSFANPLLSDWKICKSIRFVTDNVNDKKLTAVLTSENVVKPTLYDFIDIEFLYIGSFSQLYESMFKLIKELYKDVEYDVQYSCVSRLLMSGDTQNRTISSLITNAKILSADIINQNNVEDFCISYNYDGERVLLVSMNEHIFILSGDNSKDSTPFRQLSQTGSIFFNTTSLSTSSILPNMIKYQKRPTSEIVYIINVLDCEYISGTYYVIDMYMYNSNVIDSHSYTERMKFAEKYISECTSDHSLSIKLIPFLKCKSWDDIDDYSHVFKREIDGNTINVDGVICRLAKSTYLSPECYIHKDPKHCSINFKIIYVPLKHSFYLYVEDSINKVIKSTSIVNKYSQEHFGYSLINHLYNSRRKGKKIDTSDKYILFMSPYFDGFVSNSIPSFEFIPRLEWKQEGFTEKQISNIDTMMKDIINNPKEYTGKIVTMYLADDGWVPAKIKFSKASRYSYAIDTTAHIYNDLFINSRSNTYHDGYNPNMESVFTNVRTLIDQYIIEHDFNNKMYGTMLDFFDKNNINVDKMFSIGNVNTFYAVSDDKSALISYINTASNKSIVMPMFMTCIKNNQNRLIDVNIIHYIQKGKYFSNIVSELNSKYNYKMFSIDVIYIQDRTEDIFKSLSYVLDFIDFAYKVLTPNGVIIFKYFDGGMVESYINKSRHNPLGISIVNNDNDNDPEKLLTTIQTRNIGFIFGIDHEISSFKQTLKHQHEEYIDLDDNILIECETLDNNTKEYIENRSQTPYTTVVVTRSKLNIRKSCKLDNECYIYIINPKTKHLVDIFTDSLYSEEDIQKYWLFPDTKQKTMTKRQLIYKDFFKLFDEKFKVESTYNPMMKEEIGKIISSSRLYSQISSVDTFFNTMTITTLSKI